MPPIADARKVSMVVAEAVGRQAIREGASHLTHEHTLRELLEAYVWEPEYLPYERHDLAWIRK